MFNKFLNRYRNLPVQVRASFWFLICAFLQKGISFLTTPVFTRLLTTAEYGQYNIFNSWLSILTVCVALNLHCGVYSRGLVKFEKDRNVFASSLQGLTLTLICFWIIIYLLFRGFWNNLFGLTTLQMLCMFVLIWGTSVFGYWSMGQRVDFRYQKLVLVTFVMSAAKPLLGILLVILSRDKVTARIFGLAVVEFIVCIGLFGSQVWRGKKLFHGWYWKHALGFNIPLIPHYLSSSVLNGADRIMIGRMVNEASAGIYGLAYSISLIMTMFNTAMMQTMEPWLYKKIRDRKIQDIAGIAYPAFLMVALVNLALIAMAPEVVAVFAPEEYYDAIWIIPPVAMSVFFTFSYTFFAVFEFYFEKTGLIAAATCAGAVLNVILNYIFIHFFGYYAAGYTTLFCYIVYAACHFLFMRKVCRDYLANEQPYDLKIYLLIAVSFLAGGFLLLFSYPYRILRYGLIGIFLVFLFMNRKRLLEGVSRILYTRTHRADG